MLKIKGLQLPMLADEIIAGDVKFVDSGGSNTNDDPGHGGDPDKTFATWDYAIGKMAANNGDHLILLPVHAENIATTTTVDIDVAGITHIGLGRGADRPTFTHTATSAYVDVAAANTILRNLYFKGGVNTGTVAMMNIGAANILIDACEFKNISNILHTDYFIQTSGSAQACDYLTIQNSLFGSETTGDSNAAIWLEELNDFVLIRDNIFYGAYDDGCIFGASGKHLTQLSILRNILENTESGNWAIELQGNCTGFCVDNIMYTDAFATMLDPGYLKCSGNKGSIAVDSPMVTVPGIGLVGEPRLAMHTTAAMGGGTFNDAGHPDAFTVTGTVLARCWGVVTTSVTSTSDTGTLDFGCVDDLDLYISQTTVNATNLVAGDSWGCATGASIGVDLDNAGAYSVQNGGVIQFDVNTNNMTAGVLNMYCQWIPISADGNVVAI